MKVHAALATMAALLGSAGLTHAAPPLVSPALQTSVGKAGACYVRNVGTKPVSVHVEFLENFSAGFITPNFQNCNDAPLAAGKTCVLLVEDLPDDVTFECAATVTQGSVKNLRATAELRQFVPDHGLLVAAAQDLR